MDQSQHSSNNFISAARNENEYFNKKRKPRVDLKDNRKKKKLRANENNNIYIKILQDDEGKDVCITQIGVKKGNENTIDFSNYISATNDLFNPSPEHIMSFYQGKGSDDPNKGSLIMEDSKEKVEISKKNNNARLKEHNSISLYKNRLSNKNFDRPKVNNQHDFEMKKENYRDRNEKYRSNSTHQIREQKESKLLDGFYDRSSILDDEPYILDEIDTNRIGEEAQNNMIQGHDNLYSHHKITKDTKSRIQSPYQKIPLVGETIEAKHDVFFNISNLDPRLGKNYNMANPFAPQLQNNDSSNQIKVQTADQPNKSQNENVTFVSNAQNLEITPIHSQNLDSDKLIVKSPTKHDIGQCIEIKEDEISKLSNSLDTLKQEKEKLTREIETSVTKIDPYQNDRLYKIPKNLIVCSEYIEDKETIFKHVNASKEPSEFYFYDHNINSHINLRTRMKRIVRQRRNDRKINAYCAAKEYYDSYNIWEQNIRQEEESTQGLITFMPMQREQSGKRLPAKTRVDDINKKEDDIDYERFDNNISDIPSMSVYTDNYDFEKYQYIDFNQLDKNLLSKEKEMKVLNQWHPDEEKLFVKLYNKFKKDFEKIAYHIENKSTKDVIHHYYLRKYFLDLNKSNSDSNLLSTTYLGTGFDFINGTEIRGSLRLSEKNNTIEPKQIGRKVKRKKSSIILDDSNTKKLPMSEQSSKKQSSIENKTKSHWNQEEKKLLLIYLPKYGKDWEKIGEKITDRKSVV